MAMKGAMDSEAYAGTRFLGVVDEGMDMVHGKRSRAGSGLPNPRIRS